MADNIRNAPEGNDLLSFISRAKGLNLADDRINRLSSEHETVANIAVIDDLNDAAMARERRR